MNPDPIAGILRALGFLGLFQAAGTALFLVIFASPPAAAESRLRRLMLAAASTALICFLLQQALEAARFGGTLAALFDAHLQALAWHSSSGCAQVLRAAGLLLIVASVGSARRAARYLGAGGAVCALLSFLLTGHTSVHALRGVLAPLLAVHLFVAAFWFGALAPLHLVSRESTRDYAVGVLSRFSRIAGVLVPLIAIAGVAMAAILVPNRGALLEPYGLLLLAKLGAFAALMGFATYNKWRLVPVLARGDVRSFTALRRSIASESALIAGTLVVTALLTLFFSPH